MGLPIMSKIQTMHTFIMNRQNQKKRQNRRKAKMPMLSDRQYRTLPFETPNSGEKKNKFDSDCYVEGYATKFERYLLFDDETKPVYEQFLPECFRDCDMSDIIFQYDHAGKVYARLSNRR